MVIISLDKWIKTEKKSKKNGNIKMTFSRYFLDLAEVGALRVVCEHCQFSFETTFESAALRGETKYELPDKCPGCHKPFKAIRDFQNSLSHLYDALDTIGEFRVFVESKVGWQVE